MLIYNLFNVISMCNINNHVEKSIKIQFVVQFVQYCFNIAAILTIMLKNQYRYNTDKTLTLQHSTLQHLSNILSTSCIGIICTHIVNKDVINIYF